jgi:hypothetical protein
VTASAVNLQTNVTTTAVTNQSGLYLLTPLVNGQYRVTFTLAGFSPTAREVELRAGDRLRLDLALSVGALTEEGRVVAETQQQHYPRRSAQYEPRGRHQRQPRVRAVTRRGAGSAGRHEYL